MKGENFEKREKQVLQDNENKKEQIIATHQEDSRCDAAYAYAYDEAKKDGGIQDKSMCIECNECAMMQYCKKKYCEECADYNLHDCPDDGCW